MRYSYIVAITIIGIIIFLSNSLNIDSNNIEEFELSNSELDVYQTRGNVRRQSNTQPILTDAWVYLDTDEDVMAFEVNYTDLDGDEGTVMLYVDDNEPQKMIVDIWDNDPADGQYFYLNIPESEIDDYSEFYFTADDNNGNIITLKDMFNQPFLIGDFDGWGEHPELSEPDVYFDGDDWVFNVTYWDPDGDEAEDVYLYIDYEAIPMDTNDPDPYEGQEYFVYVLESDVDETTEFHFNTQDVNGSYAELSDDNWENFVVGDFLDSDGPKNGDTNSDTNGDGDTNEDRDDRSFNLGPWGDPEVIVAIIALLAMGIGSGIGIWLRKKKRKRFSNLLTKIDNVYGSYKMHPRKCERELEKLKAEVDHDLKNSVIDENNYSILKERIDDVKQEIRSESLRTKVQDLPDDIELRIKDMLIDGKITQAEYNKFMKVLKSSTMTSSDKKEMKKLMESWMKEDRKKGKK
jgi:hypothetical protein